MKTKRISDTMEEALNEQMTREAFQSQVYLSYASWAEVVMLSSERLKHHPPTQRTWAIACEKRCSTKSIIPKQST